jgi:MoxR-like ATPase
MPSDILGTNVFDLKEGVFRLTPGPIFTELLLADEINRAPAKSQRALLEAMQERQVSIDGVRHALSDHFTVFATQNPVEQEGTYPLPEAQLDRFLLKLEVAAIRERAVRELNRQDVLEGIADHDPSELVRLTAITRMTDQKMLARFAFRNDVIAVAAVKRLTDRALLADVALKSESREVRDFAVDVLDDHVLLHRIANSDTNWCVRLKARKKHAGRDTTRDVIQSELSKLRLAPLQLEKAPELSGTLDEVCRALVGDSRFRITGSVEANLPGQAEIRELGDGTTAAPSAATGAKSIAASARFLALKRTEGMEPEDEVATRVFYEIAVWRTAEDTFHGYPEEKRLDLILNPVMWSSVSNGATFGSTPRKNAPGQSDFPSRTRTLADPAASSDATVTVDASDPSRAVRP